MGSGSRAGEVLKRYIAAKLQEGVVPRSSHHPQGFHLQVFLLHQIRVLMIAMLDTIHVSPAWRSTGLPTSLIGAAGRKPRDAGATHHCTCRSDQTLNMLRDLALSSNMFRIATSILRP